MRRIRSARIDHRPANLDVRSGRGLHAVFALCPMPFAFGFEDVSWTLFIYARTNSILAVNSIAAYILGIAISGTPSTTQPRFSGGGRICRGFPIQEASFGRLSEIFLGLFPLSTLAMAAYSTASQSPIETPLIWAARVCPRRTAHDSTMYTAEIDAPHFQGGSRWPVFTYVLQMEPFASAMNPRSPGAAPTCNA
jgi:hypothetical protein